MYTKPFLAVLLLGCMPSPAIAQRHHNSWFKFTAAHAINAHYKAEAELHHRRQNGYGNHNQFDQTLMYAARFWLHYSPHHGLTFSLSPYAHFSNYKVIQTKTDEAAAPVGETRFATAVSVQSNFSAHWGLTNRTMVEYRIFEGTAPNNVRLRHRLGLRVAPTHKLALGLYSELLANLPDAHTHTFFDQHRTGALVSYKCSKHLEWELGYTHIYRRQRNTDFYWPDENLTIGIVYGF
jgi:hypothetical protein